MLILKLIASCLFAVLPVSKNVYLPVEEKQNNIVEVQEEKVRRDYVKTPSGYYEFGLSDLFSYDFLVGLVNYYVNDLNVADMSYSTNNPVNQYVLQTNDVYTCYSYVRGTRSYFKAFDVSNIVMTKEIDDDSDYPRMHYNFLFSNSSPYDKTFSIMWYAQRTDDMRLTLWGVDIDLSQSLINYLANNTGGYVRETAFSRWMISEKIGGFNAFIGNIMQSIKGDPYNLGYETGYNEGLGAGISYIIDDTENPYYVSIYNDGYATGYNDGIIYATAQGSVATEIFAGILDVSMIPVNVFLKMFEYEVFGINIAGLVSGLITIALILIMVRFVTGRKV